MTIYIPLSNKDHRQLQADPEFVPNLTGNYYRSVSGAIIDLEKKGLPSNTPILMVTFSVIGESKEVSEGSRMGPPSRLTEALLKGI
jgi:hypothetical protein